MYRGGRYPVLTPALEGSSPVQIQDTLPRPYYGAGGFGAGPFLPPIGAPAYAMPAERIGVPTLLRRPPTRRYAGPPTLLPGWGGYSIGPYYYPVHDFSKKRGSALSLPRSPIPDEGLLQAMPSFVQAPERQPIPAAPSVPPPPINRMISAPLEVQQSRGKSVKQMKKHPFPGPKALRKFRHVAFCAWFIALLKANARKNLNTRPSSMFLFGIILKEIVAALHRIYLNPSGNIYPVLNDIIGPNAYDLCSLLRGGQMGTREESVLIQELQYVIENLIYHITEIMPSTGVLGTHRKSAVFELIRSGKRFPDGYFWQVEMERLQFNDHGRTVNVGDAEGFLLMLGIFISRSLVTTILMKPVDYGLSSQPLSEVAERNLRLVATTLLFLVRRIAVSKVRSMMGMPQEIAKYLYSDEEMANIYSKLSRTFNYCEGLLREWGTEYIRRLRSSALQ